MTEGQGQRATGSGGQRGYKQLRAWQKADDLAVLVYESTHALNRSDRWLATQIRRAAVSVPANIAEGYSRGSLRDYLRFLGFARGSLGEVEYFLHFITRVSITNVNVTPIERARTECGQLLFLLIRSLRKKLDDERDEGSILREEFEPYDAGEHDDDSPDFDPLTR